METYTYKRGNAFDDSINEMVLPVCEANLNAEEREFIKTGITPQMWDGLMGFAGMPDWVRS